MNAFPLIAVDIGNASIKVGFFDASGMDDPGQLLPLPREVLRLSGRSPELKRLAEWIANMAAAGQRESLCWWIASVNRPAATSLIDWLRGHRSSDAITLLSADDLPLSVALDAPDRVGVDRLVDAVAANRQRRPQCPAVVVDVGTAITVDLISSDGVFAGGAILPGIAMAARAMSEFTDLLPLVDAADLDRPLSAVGTSTEEAISSGLFWGAVGAVRQLVERMSDEVQPPTQVIITGGAGGCFAGLLGEDVLYVPHLTLSGITISAWSHRTDCGS